MIPVEIDVSCSTKANRIRQADRWATDLLCFYIRMTDTLEGSLKWISLDKPFWQNQCYQYDLFNVLNDKLVKKHHKGLKNNSLGGFIFFWFLPLPGEMIQFDEHIFQMGWFNHQLVQHRSIVICHSFCDSGFQERTERDLVFKNRKLAEFDRQSHVRYTLKNP